MRWSKAQLQTHCTKKALGISPPSLPDPELVHKESLLLRIKEIIKKSLQIKIVFQDNF